VRPAAADVVAERPTGRKVSNRGVGRDSTDNLIRGFRAGGPDNTTHPSQRMCHDGGVSGGARAPPDPRDCAEPAMHRALARGVAKNLCAPFPRRLFCRFCGTCDEHDHKKKLDWDQSATKSAKKRFKYGHLFLEPLLFMETPLFGGSLSGGVQKNLNFCPKFKIKN